MQEFRAFPFPVTDLQVEISYKITGGPSPSSPWKLCANYIVERTGKQQSHYSRYISVKKLAEFLAAELPEGTAIKICGKAPAEDLEAITEIASAKSFKLIYPNKTS